MGIDLIFFSFKEHDIPQKFFGKFKIIDQDKLFKIMSILYTIIFCFPLLMNIIIPSCSKGKSKQKIEETNLSDFETRFLNPSTDSIESI